MRLATLLLMLMFSWSLTQAQSRVKERELKGNWKMVIDIDEEDLEHEIDHNDIPLLGRVFAKSITSMVFDIIDEIDIEMRFMDNNRLKIIIEAFGEREVEYGSWYIDRHGALVLGDFDHIKMGDHHDNDIWLMKNNRLVAYEQHGKRLERQHVYLRRLY